MRRIGLAALLALAALTAAPARAGMWFDVGAGYPVSVPANGDAASWERYPTYAFGPMPQGSLAYADIGDVPYTALRDPGTLAGVRFIRGLRLYFNGTACGCQGTLSMPTTIRLTYDPAAVAAAGKTPADLRVLFNDIEHADWAPVEGVTVNAAEHWLEFTWARDVREWRELAIVTFDIVPAAAHSWGRIKRLYR